MHVALPTKSWNQFQSAGGPPSCLVQLEGSRYFLPLDYNDGRPSEEAKFVRLEDELLAQFGGVTSVQRQFLLRGLWQVKAETFQDRVVIFTAMDFQGKSDFDVIRYLERLKGRLKKKLVQLEILITVQELMAI